MLGPDGSVASGDGGTSASADGGPTADGGGGGTADGGGGELDGGPDTSDGGQQAASCTPGTYRCAVNNAVEICNSSGTAWLYSATCSVSCQSGLCTGACTPGARRCNQNRVETCNTMGSAWSTAETCSTFCESGQCALAGLEVTSTTNLDGLQIVSGAVIVRSGATLSSPSGDLTLRASSIRVENGGSIVVAPAGTTPDGIGRTSYPCSSWGGSGGGYGEAGGSAYNPGGSPFGSSTDAIVSLGSPGADGSGCGSPGPTGGKGGGVLRLIADTIDIAGQVTAIGGGGSTGSYGPSGGGSGGGILIAADVVTLTGSASAAGGPAGGQLSGGGGRGRVKVLSGSSANITGTLTGIVTQGLLPPVTITSTTHPREDLVYNDDFTRVTFGWNRAFPSRQGYYQRMSDTEFEVPTPATGMFIDSEALSLDRNALTPGANFLHLAPVSSSSSVGLVENRFRIQMNATPPTVSSSSHPTQTAWSANPNAYFSWTFPVGDENLQGAYYVLDHYGSTVPTSSATFLPLTQKQLLRSGLAAGIWVFHVVSVDTRGYLTKQAGHYRVQIGDDPGSGVVLGQVISATSQNLEGVAVTVNRGLYTQTTNSTGNYNFGTIPAGTWEIGGTKAGYRPSTQMVTVGPGASATVNLTLNPM
jgi:hypothetical protein